ncbi:MAG: hypothetical protein GC159_03675 [Phycisphaera sp.]|nr:hypothetical protein [Phycisphaera sp.]
MGATATCAECKHQYKVDGHTLVVIEDEEKPQPATPDAPSPFDAVANAAEAGQAKKPKAQTAAQQKAAMQQQASAPRTAPRAAPPARNDIENIPVAAPAQQHIDDAMMAAPAAAPVAANAVASDIDDELPIATRRTHLDPRMSPDPTETGAYRRGGLQPIHMILGGAALVLVLVVVMFLVFSGGGDTPNPSHVSNGSTNNTNNTTNTGNPNNTTNPNNNTPEPVTPTPSPEPVTPEPSVPVVVDPAAELPFLLLDEVSAVSYNWVAIDPPLPPSVTPASSGDVVLSSVQMQQFPVGSTMLVQYLADTTQVNGSAFMHIQLLDSNKKAFAELQSKVPVVCGKQGIQFRVPVPDEFIGRYSSHVASIAPVEPLPNAVVLEPVESRFRKVGTAPGEPDAVRIVMQNPSSSLLTNPVFAVEIQNVMGYPIGTWQGGISGGRYRVEIEPGETVAFQVKLGQKFTERPARVIVRGYGIKTAASASDN